jgi:hypothetical protein
VAGGTGYESAQAMGRAHASYLFAGEGKGLAIAVAVTDGSRTSTLSRFGWRDMYWGPDSKHATQLGADFEAASCIECVW